MSENNAIPTDPEAVVSAGTSWVEQAREFIEATMSDCGKEGEEHATHGFPQYLLGEGRQEIAPILDSESSELQAIASELFINVTNVLSDMGVPPFAPEFALMVRKLFPITLKGYVLGVMPPDSAATDTQIIDDWFDKAATEIDSFLEQVEDMFGDDDDFDGFEPGGYV